MSETAISGSRRNEAEEEAVAGCAELAVGGQQEEFDDRERFCAVLDLYEQALQDLRMFARKRSVNKHMDDDQLYSRLEAKIASPDFLETLGSIHMAPAKISQETQDDQSSWDFINEKDWSSSDLEDSRNSLKLESYVVVNQEDIVDGMACFMAKYVSSLPQLKDLSPKQLQTALKKVLGASRKGRLRRLWSGSKLLYTAASWGATAVSLYNNPIVAQAASKAFWTSIQLVTKFV
ncbi:hypothetical protein GOP47_0003045 [Adiantum capillus-veneris]|uniref:Uncharacterized protein n=1 Tax=Adiantum capillus-veneris TaxID=13818 RepID=A0A9D4ZRW0_ADICA|nr:hypothetical protein GOP47_0003045 [Adiantum capillus-veneris]